MFLIEIFSVVVDIQFSQVESHIIHNHKLNIDLNVWPYRNTKKLALGDNK